MERESSGICDRQHGSSGDSEEWLQPGSPPHASDETIGAHCLSPSVSIHCLTHPRIREQASRCNLKELSSVVYRASPGGASSPISGPIVPAGPGSAQCDMVYTSMGRVTERHLKSVLQHQQVDPLTCGGEGYSTGLSMLWAANR